MRLHTLLQSRGDLEAFFHNVFLVLLAFFHALLPLGSEDSLIGAWGSGLSGSGLASVCTDFDGDIAIGWLGFGFSVEELSSMAALKPLFVKPPNNISLQNCFHPLSPSPSPIPSGPRPQPPSPPAKLGHSNPNALPYTSSEQRGSEDSLIGAWGSGVSGSGIGLTLYGF
nr:hypothetical protein Iba_chr08cCG12090 [Ipomoea batatas]